MRTQPRRLGRRTAVPLVTAALLTAGALVTVPGTASAANATAWAMNYTVPTPSNAFGDHTRLRGVAAVSTTEVWAVGSYTDTASQWHAQMLRFDGTAWKKVTLPTGTDGGGSELTAVDATATTNAWAVGSYTPAPGAQGQPLILKRAAGVWNKVAAPVSGAGWNYLNAVDMVSPTSGWAVGAYQPSTASLDTSNLILRWNGTSWTPVAVPSKPGGFNKLTSISVDGPNSAWAVGTWAASDREAMPTQTVILRWDGSTWTQWSSPNPAPDQAGYMNTLNNVIAVSPTEAWATGSTTTAGWMGRHPLILHWTGGAWTVFDAPVNETLAWEFTDAYAVSPTEIYFVGYKRGVWDFQDHDFIRRWDGTQFAVETLDMPTNLDNSGDRIVSAMGGITGLPTGQLWAVGHTQYRNNHVLSKTYTQ